jgi:hypothetical protein
MTPNEHLILRVADENLNFKDVRVTHPHPDGAQILMAAGISDQQNTVLLQLLPSGDMESIRPAEKPNIKLGLEFIAAEGDRAFFFTVDDARLEWPVRHISGGVIRKLARVPDDRELVQEHEDGSSRAIVSVDMVDLGKQGVERFVTRERHWKLRVQGVTLTYSVPEVKVADAMIAAGFDPKKAWNIFLLVAGEPKKQVDVNYIVDLRTPGLEKIRLIQRNVDNGDDQASASKLRREFELLDVDKRYLDAIGLPWEAVLVSNRRWLLIQDYELLSGYTPERSKLALDIPMDYPGAQIDMFYFAPVVSRCDGVAIPNTHIPAEIDGVTYQGWSRHRNASNPWDPHTDNVATHLALVESCLSREFGE